jgi:hypothetical protein
MPRFLVHVSQPEAIAAKRISDSVRSIGSHFATHAGWQRQAGQCTGSMVIEAADSWEALGIVPPGMRADACVFHLEAVVSGGKQPAAPRSDMQPYAVAA